MPPRDEQLEGVILYGPPAVGKDTITTALLALSRWYAPVPKLKHGTGRRDSYRMITEGELRTLRRQHRVVYENERYGNRYVLDRDVVNRIIEHGQVPVVHMGQVAGIRALLNEMPLRWCTVLLWCDQATAAARSRARGDRDVAQRTRAWEATRDDLHADAGGHFDLVLDTALRTADEAARAIHGQVVSHRRPRQPVGTAGDRAWNG